MSRRERVPAPRRRLLLAGVALALAVTASPGPAGPAIALPQAQGLRVQENQAVEQEYPPIPGQNPIPDVPPPARNLTTPDDCRTVPWCDVIPLEVLVPPTLQAADEFFVNVELSWETQRIPQGPEVPGNGPVTNETPVNDLDLYIWEEPAGEEDVAASTTDVIPEVARLFRPTKGKYQIVVVNYVGPNTGYKLKVSYKPEIIEPPFELLEPVFEPPARPVTELVPSQPPLDLSSGPEPGGADLSALPSPPVSAPVAAVPEPPVVPSLEPVPVEPDPDFANFTDSEFEDALAAPPGSDVLRERRARVVGPAEPASPASLVFWLALVPVALVAGGGVWLARRGSAVLRFK
jgi:hypothetical protein